MRGINTENQNVNQNKMTKEVLKSCHYCHVYKNKSEMQEIGVWVCNECLEKSKALDKKSVKSK